MSDGKKKRLKFLFITPVILLINVSISVSVNSIADSEKTEKCFATKTTKLCSITLVSKIIEFYRYTENENSNTFFY